MQPYLVLQIDGVMQAWGGHSYEDLRHTEIIPTRSAILGLFAACLGLDRGDRAGQQALAASVNISVRAEKKLQRFTDFHTVSDARKVDGRVNKFPVVSRREYLVSGDTTSGPSFRLLVSECVNAQYSLEDIERAVKKPVYTPFLGRRSCPLSRPLYAEKLQANDVASAFSLIEPQGGTIYSDTPPEHYAYSELKMRDVPMHGRQRQFASRKVYVFTTDNEGGTHVPQ